MTETTTTKTATTTTTTTTTTATTTITSQYYPKMVVCMFCNGRCIDLKQDKVRKLLKSKLIKKCVEKNITHKNSVTNTAQKGNGKTLYNQPNSAVTLR